MLYNMFLIKKAAIRRFFELSDISIQFSADF